MKRAEFVAQLTGYLSTHDLLSDYSPSSLNLIDLAEFITQYLERDGVLPKTPIGTNFAPKWDDSDQDLF